MSRIRTVKPELFKHEDLFDLERDTGLPIRLAFIAMFTVADREGRFKWRPRTLKVECLPHDDCDFSRVLDALATRGFVVKYACDGEVYGYIPSFNKHQVVNNREHVSDLPEPNENNILTREPRVLDASTTPLVPALVEGKGRERKGREGDSPPARRETPLDVLLGCLPSVLAIAVIEHRKAKKAPLTVFAAKELVKGFLSTGQPEAAATMMVMRGWTGFELSWFEKERTGGEARRLGSVGAAAGEIESLEGFSLGPKPSLSDSEVCPVISGMLSAG